jgi:aspartyl-tRNA(Asn)/glutamyl-tRNA(Gln) amidotransferase subunit A
MTQTNDPTHWPITKLSAEISSGRLSPVDLIEAFLERIAATDVKLNAFTEVYAKDARLAAQAAEKAIRSGHAVGPLHGVPIAIKDLAEIQGRVTTGGCGQRKNRRSQYTATLVQRLVSKGIIVLGKTHMVEFAYGGWGTNTCMGTPWNPWDPVVAHAPGGSSSGSAVAVAAGLAPWAVGTDTGGSVRVPAAWCGLTGLKTTAGRISNYGLLALSPTLDTPGPMAWSVEDANLLYQAMQGPDPHDRHTWGLPSADTSNALHRGIGGMRFARMPDSERSNIASEVLEAYDRTLDELAGLGAKIAPLELPGSFSDIASLNARIMSAESYALYADLVDDLKLALDEDVRPRVLAGRDITSHQYLSALSQRAELSRHFDQALAEFDALLTPTTATTAVPLDAIDQSKAPTYMTRFANFFDLCALALPNGADSHGLPTSLQIIGHRFDESTVLRIGSAYQDATEWHTKRPPEPCTADNF